MLQAVIFVGVHWGLERMLSILGNDKGREVIGDIYVREVLEVPIILLWTSIFHLFFYPSFKS